MPRSGRAHGCAATGLPGRQPEHVFEGCRQSTDTSVALANIAKRERARLADGLMAGPIGAVQDRTAWVRRFPNLNEFFVHHEDVRRANGSGSRTNPPAEDAALFRNVAHAPWFLSRRLRGAGLDLVWAGTDQVIRARRGQPTARLHGLPGELLLFLFGRRDAADVEITGSPEAIEALLRTPFGM
jgi:uncharacterized protein (TIGR03085 family)